MNKDQRSLEVLGLNANASPQEIRRAFRERVKAWHPDRFEHNPELKLLAEEQLKAINDAYTHLKPLPSGKIASDGKPEEWYRTLSLTLLLRSRILLLTAKSLFHHLYRSINSVPMGKSEPRPIASAPQLDSQEPFHADVPAVSAPTTPLKPKQFKQVLKEVAAGRKTINDD